MVVKHTGGNAGGSYEAMWLDEFNLFDTGSQQNTVPEPAGAVVEENIFVLSTSRTLDQELDLAVASAA